MGRLPTAARRASSILRQPLRPSPLPAPSALSTPTKSTRTRGLHSTAPLSARLIERPRRPHAFTQLVQQSDGATFTVRTTSPQPVLRAARDTRNHALWQPSDKSLRNVELDEAGKLAAFRERYGRGFDLEAASADAAVAEDGAAAEEISPAETEEKTTATGSAAGGFDLYGDLISGYAATYEEKVAKAPVATRSKGTKKKGK